MYKVCITEQSARRQRELEKGLLSLMLTHAYEDITVSSLCQDLGIPRKAFYRYFSGKDGALFALIDHTMMGFTGNFYSDDPAVIKKTMEHYFAYWKEQAPLLHALRKSGMTGILVQRCITKATEEELVSNKIFLGKDHSSQLYVLHFLVSGLIGLVLHWHANDFREPPRQIARIAVELLTRSLITPSEP